MKRILIFTTAYWPLIGGAEVAVKEITDRALDYEFDLITAKIRKGLKNKERVGRVNVYRVGFGNNFDKFLLPVLGVLKAVSLNRKRGYSFTWAIMASYGGVVALFFNKITARPFILTLQEGDSEEHILKKVGIFYSLWKRIFRGAYKVTAISNYLKDFAERHGAKDVRVIPNGVDVERFKNKFNEEERARFREELGLEKDEKVVVTVSRLVKKNGVDILIKAMREVEAKLLVVGDGEEREELEKLVKDNNLEKKVIFIGAVPFEEVSKYLWISDVFCRVPRSEGFGNVFVEAMASGVPVLASDVGGIKDFLVDGKNGLICGIDNPEEVAVKINKILEDKDLESRLIKNGLKTAKNYDWSLIAKEFSLFFDKFLDRRSVVLAAGIYPPDTGGPATYIKRLEEFLLDKLWDTSVVTYGEKNIRRKGFVSVSRGGVFVYRQVRYLMYLFIESFGKCFIYAFDVGSSGLAGYMVSLMTGKPLVLRIGGDLLWEREASLGFRGDMEDFYNSQKTARPFRFWVARLIMRRAKVVFVPAQSLVKIYKKYYGVKEENLKILPNVIEKQSWQKKSLEAKKILFAGRFVSYKNLDLLLEIAGEIEAKFYIVGDGPERKKLEKFVKDNNLGKKVYIYDYLKKQDLYDLIKSCDLGISLSQVEYNPNFILECLSLGLPVVLNRDNGLTASLPDEFLVDVKDKEEITQKINYIFENYKEALGLVKNNFKEYSFEESFELFLDTLDKKEIC